MDCNNHCHDGSKGRNKIKMHMKKLIATFGLAVAVLSALSQSHAIRVSKTGEGAPVVFLPGFTTPGAVWTETVQHLEGAFESHLISYAGFDGVEPIEMPWYEAIKKELLGYIERENLSGIRIVGHSMGGTLAIDIASEVPERIHSLVLVDALPCMRELMMPGTTAEQIQYESPYNQRMLGMTEEAFGQVAAMMAQNMTRRADKLDVIKAWSMKADRKTYVYGFTDLLKLDLRPALRKVTANTLILGAPFPDAQVVKANFEKQYAGLGNKTIEIAEDSKHFIMFDQPEWFYGKLNAFFSK